ncbi:MAG TPA: tRNA 2-thiouridine(34) synthase MnmA, partial [Burkholderiaceae bacterium]|nr:tRNA 2-thiouridine(34) synthase MnmA [Burkholderiaceae bacterium]
LDHALQLGADHIATGHYARVREVGAAFQLLKAIDTSKDQSYFLHRLNQAQLSKTLFPLGEIHKTEVRQIAARLNLPNARKKDSTGICFIGERPFREFLNRYLSYQAGPMKTAAGDIVGQHVGLSFYTLGQRKGIGLGGLKAHRSGDGDSAPWYVAGKDMASNTLYVVQGHDHPWLLADALTARQASWIAGTAPVSAQLSAKTRYRQADVACRFAVGDDASFRLDFDNPQWAVTPGQSAVLYDGEVCLGGGVIDSAEAAAVA